MSMKKRPYDLIIFDWDGTLANSIARIVHCIQLAAKDCGFDGVHASDAQHIIGLGLEEAITALYPPATSADIQRMALAYRHHWHAQADEPLILYPNAAQVLAELNTRAILAVATGKSRQGLDHALMQTGLSDYFTITRCGEETLSKPHPLMLEQILHETGMEVSQAVMIGDTSFDLEMARTISMDCIATSYGAHDTKTLAEFQPIAIIDNLNELLPVV